MQEKAKNTIPNQKIYDDIIAFRGTQKYRDSESKLLRNKYAFLMDHVFYRKRSHFMDGSKAVVPEMEAAIVRNLLYKAITPSDNNLIMDWFNNTDFSDPYKTVELFEQIIKEVEKAVHTGETDPATADECLHAISASLNYGGALYTIYLNREMNKFRIDSLAMNSTVIFGDVVITHEDGAREYLKKGNAANVNLDEKSLEQAIQSAENQDDYLNIIAQVIKKCSADAEEKNKGKVDEGHHHESRLLQDYRKDIFIETQSYRPYYLAAFLSLQVDWMFRRHQLDKHYLTYKYHVMLLVKELLGGESPNINLKKDVEKYCAKVESKIRSYDDLLDVAINACSKFEEITQAWINENGEKAKYNVKDNASFAKFMLEFIRNTNHVDVNKTTEKVMQGKILNFQTDKKGDYYGFIKMNPNNIFFSEKDNPGIEITSVGREVYYEVVERNEKKYAVNMRFEQ